MTSLAFRCCGVVLVSGFRLVLLIMILFGSALLGQSTGTVARSGVRHQFPAEIADTPNRQLSFDAHLQHLRVDVNLVMIPVTVTDSSNHPITNLQKDNFELYEDDKRQVIDFFLRKMGPFRLA